MGYLNEWLRKLRSGEQLPKKNHLLLIIHCLLSMKWVTITLLLLLISQELLTMHSSEWYSGLTIT